ncbi:MAG: hydrogenase [Arcobacteraceae bacterium]|jgi:hydrogenase small subunit|nr:hydrogenase [Arcobacteraceae bacterium]
MKSKMRLLWLSGISCNGNAHSFLNYPHLEHFLNHFEFIYHPIIDSHFSLEDIVKKTILCDILLIEGAISQESIKADTKLTDIINNYAPIVKKIITVGTCATFGGIFKEQSFNDTAGLHFLGDKTIKRFENLKDKTISISGCPIHPEILAETLYAIKNEIEPKLDSYLRPKEYFAYTIHNGCTRNEYFEYKIDNHNFGVKEGCMFYEHGCQAPFTNGSCNKILWNEINSKTRAGVPCMGCTEPTFPKENLFSTKRNMGIPQHLPLGVNKRAYLTLAGIAKAFTIDRLENKLME